MVEQIVRFISIYLHVSGFISVQNDSGKGYGGRFFKNIGVESEACKGSAFYFTLPA